MGIFNQTLPQNIFSNRTQLVFNRKWITAFSHPKDAA